MTEYSKRPPNPLLGLDDAREPLYRLKLALVLYLDYAPGPRRTRLVYDSYFSNFGSNISMYQSTSFPGPPRNWNYRSRRAFELEDLPQIQQRSDWGYVFRSDEAVDNSLFMVHGYKPVTESGKASFFRFEWPWDADGETITRFACDLAKTVPFLSGTGGYILSARPLDKEAFNRSYAICQRYWGIEAWELDRTVKYMLDGYKCPSWLTLIGHRLLERLECDRSILAELQKYQVADAAYGSVYRSREAPALLDQNRRDDHQPETAIATTLMPLQTRTHEDFSGPRWKDSTRPWLYRFTG